MPEREGVNMFLATKTIVDSIERLKNINPFYGITYLACKENNLPAGATKELSLDNLTKAFMDKVHKIHPSSKYYFQPYESNIRDKRWVVVRYPSTGLQSINTRGFPAVFIHSALNRTWGWSRDYVNILAEKLDGKLLSALDLGIWFFKNNNWSEGTSYQNIITEFFSYFHITLDEQKKLFLPIELSVVSRVDFQETETTWNELRFYLPSPPDAIPERGATLSYLEINNVGPASQLVLEPSKHLNLITGDNGLGKTFLMECAWWAMTATWPDSPVYPANGKQQASIIYGLSGVEGKYNKNQVLYDTLQRKWSRELENEIRPGLIVYARIDGSYAVWDPAKLLNIQPLLSTKPELQYIISTHSPLVLASSETYFDEAQDSLFHLEIDKVSRQVL
jgi:hypothetical protein